MLSMRAFDEARSNSIAGVSILFARDARDDAHARMRAVTTRKTQRQYTIYYAD